MEGLELWNEVGITNPANTKKVRKKGYEITAIDPYAQIKKATEIWGPYGASWGFRNVETKIVGADEYTSLLFSAIFWYPHGEFPILADIGIITTGKNGSYRTEDAAKKVYTDALTKALSMLGFNSDVFLGRFDDNKYVEEMKEKFSNEVNASRQEAKQVEEEPDERGLDRYKSLFALVEENIDQLTHKGKMTKEQAKKRLDHYYDDIRTVEGIEKKLSEIKAYVKNEPEIF